jgi:PAS domain S-box-containing protein
VATECPGGVVETHRRLDPLPESARAARCAVLAALDEAGRADLAEAAVLLVSELVTNAIVHARTPIDLDIIAGPDGLRVAVRDASPQLPTLRHYGRSATTGRGLELVELMADRHGTDSDADDGKTVWFELGSTVAGRPTADGPPSGEPAELTVRLDGLPVPLVLAWQQHADALLREMTLAHWDPNGSVDTRVQGQDVAAGEALATVASALEGLGPAAQLPPYADLALPMRRDTAAHFDQLDAVMDHAVLLAEQGLTLAPPTQPEIRVLRRWLCEQVRTQAAGGSPGAWPGLPPESPAAEVSAVEWDATAVRAATEAVVAADDVNRIVAASPAALDLLGWDDTLLGRRIVAVIPERFREAHIAAFTLHLLTGETRILDREVTVPALRRDGSEVTVRLLVRREGATDGRVVFTATMRQP